MISSTSELAEDADGGSAGRDDDEGEPEMPEFRAGVAPDTTRHEESCEHFRTISKKVLERLAASAP